MRAVRSSASFAIGLVVCLLTSGCQTESEPTPSPSPGSGVASTAAASPSQSQGPSPSAADAAGCEADACATLVVTGDMLFHPGLWNQYKAAASSGRNFDFTPLLAGETPYLDTADLAICHMETPLAPSGGPYSSYPIFSIPPEIAQDAKTVGYDACTQASNHSVDQGTAGIERSIAALEAAGLGHTGIYATKQSAATDILMVQTPAAKVAIIGGTFSLNGLRAEHSWQVDGIKPATLIAKAKRARADGADIVVAGLHIGTEYQTRPNSAQIALDRALIDSGEFDFVYNHHSHAAQPLEYYHGKWIAYSLGNNISESSSYRVNNEFLMVRIQFAKGADGRWSTGDIAWVPAINKQDGRYKWCSVAQDAPQGVCVSKAFDAQSRDRLAKVVNAFGADEDGAHPFLLSGTE